MSIFWKKVIPVAFVAIVTALIIGFLFAQVLVVGFGVRNYASIAGYSVWFLLGAIISYVTIMWSYVAYVKKHILEYETQSASTKHLTWRQQMDLLKKVNIETSEEATGVITAVSNILYLLVALVVIATIAISIASNTSDFVPDGIFSGIVLALCAFLLNRKRNIFAASIVFIVGILGTGLGGSVLAIIVLIVSVKALQAVFKLKSLGFPTELNGDDVSNTSALPTQNLIQPIILKSSPKEAYNATARFLLILQLALPFFLFLLVYFLQEDLSTKIVIYILSVIISQAAFYYGRKSSKSRPLIENFVEITNEGVNIRNPLFQKDILFTDIVRVVVIQDRNGKILKITLRPQNGLLSSVNIMGLEDMMSLYNAVSIHVDPRKIQKKTLMAPLIFVFIVVFSCTIATAILLFGAGYFFPTFHIS